MPDQRVLHSRVETNCLIAWTVVHPSWRRFVSCLQSSTFLAHSRQNLLTLPCIWLILLRSNSSTNINGQLLPAVQVCLRSTLTGAKRTAMSAIELSSNGVLVGHNSIFRSIAKYSATLVSSVQYFCSKMLLRHG